MVLLGVVLNAAVLVLPTVLCGQLASFVQDDVAPRLVFLVSLFCGTEVWFTSRIGPMAASPSEGDSAADRTARRVACCTGLLLLIIFGGAAWHRGWNDHQPASWQQATGAAMLLAGTALRAAAICSLGVRFRTEVQIPAAHQLDQAGIYRLMRHPSETGLLAAAMGACTLTGWWPGFIVGLSALAPLVLWRVSLEERCLAAVHGEVFCEYRRRVGCFLPKMSSR
jgi:protein-S-isoprenylcysteine O-methyltransferase Ste14